jgi:chromosome segregation ATPase
MCQKLQQQRDNLQDQLLHKQAALAEAETDIRQLRAAAVEPAAAHPSESDALRTQAQQKLASLTKKIYALNDVLDNKSGAVTKFKSTNATLHSQLQVSEARAIALESDKSSLESQLEHAQKQLEACKTDFASVTTQAKTLQTQLDDVTDSKSRLSLAHKAQGLQLDESERALSTLRTEHLECATLRESTLARLQIEQQSAEEMRTELDDLKRSARLSGSAQSEGLRDQINDMTANYNSMRAALTALQVEHASCTERVTNAQQAHEDYQQKYETIVDLHADCGVTIERLRLETKELRNTRAERGAAADEAYQAEQAATATLKQEYKQLVTRTDTRDALIKASQTHLRSMKLRVGIQFDPDPKGVSVIQVFPKSPASYADLLVGDTVEEVNGVAVTSRDDFMRALREIQPGDRVPFQIRRARYGAAASSTETKEQQQQQSSDFTTTTQMVRIGAIGFSMTQIALIRRLAAHRSEDFDSTVDDLAPATQ